jgi:hypothetical protein
MFYSCYSSTKLHTLRTCVNQLLDSLELVLQTLEECSSDALISNN